MDVIEEKRQLERLGRISNNDMPQYQRSAILPKNHFSFHKYGFFIEGTVIKRKKNTNPYLILYVIYLPAFGKGEPLSRKEEDVHQSRQTLVHQSRRE